MQKMADGVVLDLYGEDLDKEFGSQNPDGFSAEGVDLYDDISSAPPEVPTVPTTVTSVVSSSGETPPGAGNNDAPPPGANGVANNAPAPGTNHIGRRFQLYIGNLTWWTTDHDISNAMRDIGVSDFQEVKFFENRSNGQSKGFCVVSMGSEASLRTVLERFGNLELHGQTPAVTYPTKQALNQFESMQKTRPVPPPQQNGPVRGPAPQNVGGMGGPMSPHPAQQGVMPPGHPARMMNPNMPPGQYRPQNMQHGPPMGPNPGPARMQSPMHQGGAPLGGQQPMLRYPQNQNQWAGQPRANGPRPGPPNMSPQQRPQMYQGPPGAMPMRGARPDWNRPTMHGGFPPQGPQGPPQGPPHMQGPPRGPPQMGGPGVPPGGPGGPHGPVPHVNPAFFQGGGPPQHHGGMPMGGPPHGPPGPGPQQPPMNMPPQHGPPHFPQQGPGPRGPWPGPPQGKPQGPFPEQPMMPQMSEAEFEEVMSRNRTVSSSAIARAVSDAATGEYTSAIETLVTAISLIKQSKVANDERCKILISSLQDTLHGIESKSFNRRERSRSRDRSHRTRSRRERSVSRYRERSRERDRDREANYRERSRSRERERGGGGGGGGAPAADHYRDDSSSRSGRPRKSPEPAAEPAGEPNSKRSYYEERYRSSDRERERDRERGERERERDRDRERDREHRSRH